MSSFLYQPAGGGGVLISGHISFKFQSSNQKLKCPKYVILTLLIPDHQTQLVTINMRKSSRKKIHDTKIV